MITMALGCSGEIGNHDIVKVNMNYIHKEYFRSGFLKENTTAHWNDGRKRRRAHVHSSLALVLLLGVEKLKRRTVSRSLSWLPLTVL